jgi:hypothetical protein
VSDPKDQIKTTISLLLEQVEHLIPLAKQSVKYRADELTVLDAQTALSEGQNTFAILPTLFQNIETDVKEVIDADIDDALERLEDAIADVRAVERKLTGVKR